MSILRVDAIRDNGGGFNDVVTFANNGGTENGRLCRLWVNFNGVGAVAIRASFNVNSITDNGLGDYICNFSNAMVDANYCAVSATSSDANAISCSFEENTGNDRSSATASSLRFKVAATTFGADRAANSLAIFR